MADVPDKYLRFYGDIITTLREMGGSGARKEVTARVLNRWKFSPADLARKQNKYIALENEVHWARNDLVLLGLIDNSVRGVWRLTNEGSVSELNWGTDGGRQLARDWRLRANRAKPRTTRNSREKLDPVYQVSLTVPKVVAEASVTVPNLDGTMSQEDIAVDSASEAASTRHCEIQYELAKLGADLGLDVWIARNDRGKSFKGLCLGQMPQVTNTMPVQFNIATQKTIELIDVLWLKGNSIIAAFEVECTTSIYSGLLRMSDLMALQPNLEIKLYLVAPDDRRDKVQTEIRRPTFSLRTKPLPNICGFISFSKLTDTLAGINNLGIANSLNSNFLDKIAEYFN